MSTMKISSSRWPYHCQGWQRGHSQQRRLLLGGSRDGLRSFQSTLGFMWKPQGKCEKSCPQVQSLQGIVTSRVVVCQFGWSMIRRSEHLLRSTRFVVFSNWPKRAMRMLLGPWTVALSEPFCSACGGPGQLLEFRRVWVLEGSGAFWCKRFGW